MREKMALLLALGVVAATPLVHAQQRTMCTAPISEPQESPDSSDVWDREPAFFQKAIWRTQH